MTGTVSEEAALSKTFPGGGEDELEQAVILFGRPLIKYCHGILCDYQDAQEAAQTTFYKAYVNRKRFAPGSSLQAWLWRIAYRTCIDHIRREKIRRALPLNQIASEPYTDGPEEQSIMRQSIMEALETLSPRERALVYGRLVEGRSYEELEAILGGNQVALRKQFERTRKKLAGNLQEFEEGGISQ